MKGCMIAGVSSGSGKTAITTGILGALKAGGYYVAPFKCGPDYIDTGFHTAVTGRDSINLDTYLCSEDTVRHLYTRYSEGADFGIVEGVMGLYDGLGEKNSLHSSAHVAKTLGLPVILVVDGSGLSMSAAAIVKGFAAFDRKVHIAGVIFNRISSEGHYQLLKCIIEDKAKIPCIGYLPQDPALSLPERHLGLVPACETKAADTVMDKLKEAAAKHIDLNLLKNLCAEVPKAPLPGMMQDFLALYHNAFAGKKIAVARDEAFHFYYRPNLDLLSLLGAEIVYFSPLRDSLVPDADACYLGGGFPEMFAAELTANTAVRKDLKEKLEDGLPCFAECGGLMYLCESIYVNGGSHDMCGFLPAGAVMTDVLQHFGYKSLRLHSGKTIRVHEFHYTKLIEKSPMKSAYSIMAGGKRHPYGAAKKNTIAGFPHLHFLSNPYVVPELFGLS